MNDNRPKRQSAIDVFFKLVNAVAWVCFVTMLAVMLVQVFTRYVVNHPLAWTEELSRFAYIWAIFLGAILAQRTKSHMTVTILTEKFPPKIRQATEVFVDLFSIAALSVMLYGTAGQLTRNWGILASSIPISYTWVYLAPFICAGSMIILLLAALVKDVKILFSQSHS